MKILRISLVIIALVVGRAFHANAQMETNLYSFRTLPDGSDPRAGLVQGSDGNFYGTTYAGGTSNFGTVFRISPSGTYTSLYSFVGSPNDGTGPTRLAQGSDGNFYGTTYGGGTHHTGTVFRISPGGSYSNLYSFGSSPTDGAIPPAGLVQGSDGNFYGTTEIGGTANLGTVFRISANGNYTSLYSFSAPLAMELIHFPVWYRVATAISMGRPFSAGRAPIAASESVAAPYFGSVPAATKRISTPLLSPSPVEPLHLPDWCRAVTAISTGRRMQAARRTWAPYFGSVPVAATRVFTRLAVPSLMGSIQPGWCRAATAISTEPHNTAGRTTAVPYLT